jgi:hypothetical protein
MNRIMAAGLALGLLATNALAQRVYDPKTVETVTGKIIKLDTIVHKQGTGAGLHATLQSATTTVEVHFGPVWYWQTLSTKLQVGDELAVTGSRVTINGATAVIAAEVKRGTDVLTLRDQTGRPVWAGGGKP